jgi:hypothetical protein
MQIQRFERHDKGEYDSGKAEEKPAYRVKGLGDEMRILKLGVLILTLVVGVFSQAERSSRERIAAEPTVETATSARKKAVGRAKKTGRADRKARRTEQKTTAAKSQKPISAAPISPATSAEIQNEASSAGANFFGLGIAGLLFGPPIFAVVMILRRRKRMRLTGIGAVSRARSRAGIAESSHPYEDDWMFYESRRDSVYEADCDTENEIYDDNEALNCHGDFEECS